MHCLKFHSVFPIHYSWNLINFTAQFSMLKQFTDQTLFMSMDVSVREFVCGKPSLSVTGPCYFDTIPNANQKTKTWKSFSTSFNHSLSCASLKRQEFPITSTDSFNFNWIFMFSCYGKKMFILNATHSQKVLGNMDFEKPIVFHQNKLLHLLSSISLNSSAWIKSVYI